MLIFINIANAIEYSVGVSPPFIDAGTIERESSKIIKFYITTISDETLLVYLEPQDNSIDFFNIDSHRNLIYNYSEESVKEWIEFINNPVELKPTNETIAPGIIRGKKEINFLINIPKDADPGYHVINIKPNPVVLSKKFGPVGSNVVAVTSINVLFNVPGEAKRDGIILDIIPEKFTGFGQILPINVHFQNMGTVSIVARAKQKIYDKNGSLITEIYSAKEILRPNEIKNLKTFLPTSGFLEGIYNISTTVDFTTNITTKNFTLSLYPTIVEVPKTEEYPLWIILIIIIIIILIYYKR